jgi:hypothetical protein
VKLTVEQSRAGLDSHGVYLTEACDHCGKLLGAVPWTRRGEPGEWCSQECRDGVEEVQARQMRRAGRPPKYRSERERQLAVRAQAASRQREFRQRLGVTQNALLAD